MNYIIGTRSSFNSRYSRQRQKSELAQLEREERELLQELDQLRAEDRGLEAELQLQRAASRQLELAQLEYWRQHAQYELQLLRARDEYGAVRDQLRHNTAQLDRLQRTDVLSAAFNIVVNLQDQCSSIVSSLIIRALVRTFS